MELREEDFKTKVEVLVNPKKKIKVSSDCDGCGSCVSVCPTEAIKIVSGKLNIEGRKCVACYACAILCPKGAIEISWFDGKSLKLDLEQR